MAINLQKGQRISLDKSMKRALIGLGWDTNRYDGGGDFDLDASVFLIGPTGKMTCDEDFVFYNNLESRNGAVKHMGDNRTGAGDGDDEVILVDFTKIPEEILKLVICVTIHEAEQRRQNFGQVSNAYVRVAKLNDENDTQGEDQLRFDLEEEFYLETGIVVCEIYKHDGEWKFNAVAAGYQGGLQTMLNTYN